MVEKWYSPSSITVEGTRAPKLEENWDESKMKKGLLNAKAINALVMCSALMNSIGCILLYGKKIWDILEVTL